MKLVREHINEKFSEEMSDPINDMGIGGYSFDLLKPGAVLKAKTKTSIKKDNSGYLTNWGKGFNVDVDRKIIVISVRNYILKGYKEFTIFIPSESQIIDDESIKHAREQLKTNPNFSSWGNRTRMLLTKVQFNSKFEVIEKGWE
jgi:hypothetical protein